MTIDTSAWQIPHPSPLSEPFWHAANEGQLVLQRCDECGAYRWTPQILCRECMSEKYAWRPASGKGKLHSFTVVHRAPDPALDVPYVIATVELEEGPLMLTRLIDIEPSAVTVGMPLAVAFTRLSPEINAYTFRPG